MSEVNIKHVGYAAFLRYCLGDDAHTATTKIPTGFTFSFDDKDDQCNDLHVAFYSPEGAAVGNARALLDCAKAIKTTLAIAKRLGSWENNGEDLYGK